MLLLEQFSRRRSNPNRHSGTDREDGRTMVGGVYAAKRREVVGEDRHCLKEDVKPESLRKRMLAITDSPVTKFWCRRQPLFSASLQRKGADVYTKTWSLGCR